MEIKTIALPQTLPDDFYKLGQSIYSTKYPWLPPIIDDVKEQMENKDFYQHKTAVAILVYKESELVARAVFYDDSTSRFKTTGFFGHWETIDNIDITRALFHEGKKWLKERGKTKLLGPINFNIFNGFRLLVDEHQSPAIYREARNPIYYNEHLKALGMKEDGLWDLRSINHQQIDQLEKIAEEIYLKRARPHFKSHFYRSSELDEFFFPIFREVLQKRVKESYFSKISINEFEASLRTLFRINRSEQVLVINENRELLGLCLTHFDYAPFISQNNGQSIANNLDSAPHMPQLIVNFLSHDPLGEDLVIEGKLLRSLVKVAKKNKVDKILIPLPRETKGAIVENSSRLRSYALYLCDI